MMSLPLTHAPLLPSGGGLGPAIPPLSAVRGIQAPKVVAPFVASALSQRGLGVDPWTSTEMPPGYVPGTLGPGQYAPYQPPYVPSVYSPGGPDSNGLPPPGSAGPRLIWAEMAPVGSSAARFMPSTFSAGNRFSAEGPGQVASWGAARTKSGGGGWDTAAKITSAAAPAAGAAVVAAGLAAFPFGTIATLAAVGVAAGFKIAGAIRARRLAALNGDEAAVAKWAERAPRWGKKKRKRVATRLLKERQLLDKRIDKRQGKGRKVADARLGKLKLLDMKLGVLYALESHAVKKPQEPMVEGDPETVPVTADAAEAQEATWVPMALAGGFGLLAVAGIVHAVRK